MRAQPDAQSVSQWSRTAALTKVIVAYVMQNLAEHGAVLAMAIFLVVLLEVEDSDGRPLSEDVGILRAGK